MKKLWSAVLALTAFQLACAQTPVQVLQGTLNKLSALKSVGYKVTFVTHNPFSNGDVSAGTTQSALVFDNAGQIKQMLNSTDMNNGQAAFKEIYRNDTLHSLDLIDSIYTFKAKPKSTGTDITDLTALLKTEIAKNASKIVRLKDTVVAKRAGYNFLVKSYDVMEKGNHNFTYNYIVVDKRTLLPLLYKNIGQGITLKDGYEIGRLKFYTEKVFTNYHINQLIEQARFNFNKAGFSAPVKQMLTQGTTAPPLKLKYLNNQNIPPNILNNKLLLVEFGSTTCAANPLANPLLNRLNKKYASKNFSIVSIYSSETPDQLKKYIETNKLEFPVYMATRRLTKDFQTTGTPNFYLIDKNGVVIKSINGYSDELESELVKAIDGLIEK
jgi:thiol-disulfide isomerase/thioredoxin